MLCCVETMVAARRVEIDGEKAPPGAYRNTLQTTISINARQTRSSPPPPYIRLAYKRVNPAADFQSGDLHSSLTELQINCARISRRIGRRLSIVEPRIDFVTAHLCGGKNSNRPPTIPPPSKSGLHLRLRRVECRGRD